MVGIILLFMVVLYFYGYVQIPGITVPNPALFSIHGHPVLLASFLIFIAILWTITVLPPILRIIGIILLTAWTLTELGFVVVAGLSNFLTVAVIITLFVVIFR
jgi:hypothetical protein